MKKQMSLKRLKEKTSLSLKDISDGTGVSKSSVGRVIIGSCMDKEKKNKVTSFLNNRYSDLQKVEIFKNNYPKIQAMIEKTSKETSELLEEQNKVAELIDTLNIFQRSKKERLEQKDFELNCTIQANIRLLNNFYFTIHCFDKKDRFPIMGV